MEDEELRKKIYHLLGLPFGSLSSESGNDWQRAEQEILEDYKLSQKKETSHNKFNRDEVMSSDFKKCLCEKIEIAKETNLTKDEIDYLFKSNDKDVILNLIRNDYLDDEQKEYILNNGTYLCKKEILSKN